MIDERPKTCLGLARLWVLYHLVQFKRPNLSTKSKGQVQAQLNLGPSQAQDDLTHLRFTISLNRPFAKGNCRI